MKKVCTSCKLELPVSEFYAHKTYGRRHSCKACQKKYNAARHKANPEKATAYYEANKEKIRKCRATPEKRAKGRVYANKYRQLNEEKIRERADTFEQRARKLAYARKATRLNPEKARARHRVGYALKTGALVRKPCEQCGTERTHAHHDDYSKPLDVRWLCIDCHHAHHNLTRDAESR